MQSLETHVIHQCLALAMENKMTFGETVMKLRAIGVERYNVDLVGGTATYYSTAGEVYSLRRGPEHSAIIAEDFSDAGIAHAVQAIKIRQIDYPEFLQCIMNAENLDHGVALPVIVEEARIGCMTAMLMCLDRRQRAAFILGEIFGVEDAMGAEILEVSNVNFRQLLSRARRDLYQFMNGKRGLVNTGNPCRCAKKARGFMEKGYLDPLHRQFTADHASQIRDVAPDRLADLTSATDHAHALLFREHPMLPPEDQTRIISELLQRGGLENL